MSLIEKVRAALDLESLELPARPVVEAIEADPYEDSSGKDSLEVWVILSDCTSDSDLSGENVTQIKAVIRERLLSKGIHLFPYVRMAKRSEHQLQASSE